MIQQRIIHHTHRDTDLESIFVCPRGEGPFPAVLLIHEYTGLNTVTVNHAKRLAEAGFAVLAADFYGIDHRPADIDEARTAHRVYRDNRLLMRERASACLKTLTGQPEVDPRKVSALGFSFGGGAVLELARTSAELSGVASVYGYLDTSHPTISGEIRCPLLAIHVENDPVVPEEHLQMFQAEMNNADVEYKLIRIQNAKHGFANAKDDAFDATLAEEMWSTVLQWLA